MLAEGKLEQVAAYRA